MMKQMTAMVVKPVCRLTENVRASNITLIPARSVLHVDEKRHHDDGHERDRQRRAERPVPALAELQLDEVAEHHVLAATEHARRYIGAERRDKDEDRARYDAGLYERNDDPTQHLKATGIEIVSRLDEAKIELLHARIERQHHQRQIHV